MIRSIPNLSKIVTPPLYHGKNRKGCDKINMDGKLTLCAGIRIIFLFRNSTFSLLSSLSGLIARGIEVGRKSDKVFPYSIVTGLPTGMTGLLIASIFVARTSAVFASINSSATVSLSDY
jgi:SSS family solute:Na+ symporter